ncbi:hypothetical protein U1Q18_009032 [Sarracenia purpurea var. burkii]
MVTQSSKSAALWELRVLTFGSAFNCLWVCYHLGAYEGDGGLGVVLHAQPLLPCYLLSCVLAIVAWVLLSYLPIAPGVWSLWKEGQALDMVDSAVSRDLCPAPEVLRCIHIGLLCVQEFATDRPTMSDVAFMLCNESMTLPSPKQPAFIFRRPAAGADSSSTSAGGTSTLGNDVTITTIQGR